MQMLCALTAAASGRGACVRLLGTLRELAASIAQSERREVGAELSSPQRSDSPKFATMMQ